MAIPRRIEVSKPLIPRPLLRCSRRGPRRIWRRRTTGWGCQDRPGSIPECRRRAVDHVLEDPDSGVDRRRMAENPEAVAVEHSGSRDDPPSMYKGRTMPGKAMATGGVRRPRLPTTAPSSRSRSRGTGPGQQAYRSASSEWNTPSPKNTQRPTARAPPTWTRLRRRSNFFPIKQPAHREEDRRSARVLLSVSPAMALAHQRPATTRASRPRALTTGIGTSALTISSSRGHLRQGPVGCR